MTKNSLIDWLMWIIAIIISVGIGGLFLNGTFLNVFLLKLLPQIVHTIVGWIIIVGTLVGAITKLLVK